MKTNPAPRHESQHDYQAMCFCIYCLPEIHSHKYARLCINNVLLLNSDYIFILMWCVMTDVYVLDSASIFRLHRTEALCFSSSLSHQSRCVDRHKENIINVKMRGITSLYKGPDSLRSLTDKLFLSNWNVLSVSEVYQLEKRTTVFITAEQKIYWKKFI